MDSRTLGVIAAVSLLVPVTAYADPPGGDIVDQILKTLPPAPGHPAAMVSADATPPPPPSAAVTPAPPSPAPTAPPVPPPASTVAVTPLPPATEPAPVPTPVPAAAPAPPSTDVLAQQAPPAAASTDNLGQWTGLYLGGNFGYGFTGGGSGLSCLNSTTGDTSGCPVISSSALKTSGVFGGAQMGYLMPLSTLTLALGATPSPVMIGIEGDIQGSGIDGRQTISGPISAVGFPGPGCTTCTFTASQGIDWFSTVRGRIGVPVDDVFIYATGGVMFGKITASQTLSIGGGGADTVTVKKTNVGPVVGGGLEFALSGPFTAKIEGLYYDLGTVRTASLPVGGAPVNFTDFKTFGYRGGIIRVGINVKLGGLGGS